MQVSQIMHKGVSIAQINDSLKHVASVMQREDIGSMPVYKNQRPVGFVTDRDIVISCVANGTAPDQPVSLAMTSELYSIRADKDVLEASELMRQKQISRLLVVDKGENPIGMISLQDITPNLTGRELRTNIMGIKKF